MSQHIYTYDPVNGLEEIGGAGHIIEDAAGVTYAKRENLQFEGASITDDATNNKTVVTITDTNFVGTMAQWNALTTAQKAQYKTVDLTDDFNGEPIDDALSTTSEHTVQNKVVTAAINGKAQTDHASSSATYGLGTAANYGHNKIIDNLTKTSLASGEALSAHMGNTLGKMFAPIEAGPKYSTSYAAGTQFVYNGILYKTTTAVTSASDINTGSGGNATAAGNITSQISNLALFTQGTYNWAHGNITVEYADWYRYGNVVILSFAFTVNQEITGSVTALLSGFPSSRTNNSNYKERWPIMERTGINNYPLLVGVTNGGVLQNEFTVGNAVKPGTYQGSLVYIAV